MDEVNVASLDCIDLGFNLDGIDGETQQIVIDANADITCTSANKYTDIMNGNSEEIVQARIPDIPFLKVTDDNRFEALCVNQPLTGTKQDLPDISRVQFDNMMNEDPNELTQCRIPDEFLPFPEPMRCTKEDLPNLSVEEFAKVMNEDPNGITQARIPDEFPPFPKPLTGTKGDLPDFSGDEFETLMNKDPQDIMQPLMGTKEDVPNLSQEEFYKAMSGNPDDITQARIPDEFPPFPKQQTETVKADCDDDQMMPDVVMDGMVMPQSANTLCASNPLTGTKADLANFPSEEFYILMKGDPEDIVQARIPDEFPPFPKDTGTKADLPELSREEFDNAMNGDHNDIAQARIPDEFPPFPKPQTETVEADCDDYQMMPDDVKDGMIMPQSANTLCATNPLTGTKADIANFPSDEFYNLMKGDPEDMVQARIPEEFAPFPKDTGANVDLPELSREEFDNAMDGDHDDIVQARIPDEFPPFPKDTGTKADLPELSREEFDNAMDGDHDDIVQARIPDEFPPFPKDTGTKVDLPELSREEFDNVMNGDHDDIAQARISDEFPPFSQDTGTKSDLPGLSREEFDNAMNGDHDDIAQARIPDEYPPFPKLTGTKEDLCEISKDEFGNLISGDPQDITQARIPDGFPPFPESLVDTKEYSPYLTRDDYARLMTEDLDNLVQAKIPDNFPALPGSENHVGTKEDLPHLTPSEYEAMESRNPNHIEQARIPVVFPPFNTEEADPVDNSLHLDHESPLKVTSIQNNTDEFNDFDFDLPAKVSTVVSQPQSTEQAHVPDTFPVHTPADLPTADTKSPMDALHSQCLISHQTQPTETDVHTEASEWDNVQEITARFDDSESPDKRQPVVETTPLISTDEVIHHFETLDLTQYMPGIKTSVARHGFSAFCHTLFGPPKLSKDLRVERDRVFCIAACPFNNEDPIHFRVLKTIYRRLTGSKFDPQRFGAHWDDIGFQGNDPASDLRGTGFLGLLHLLYLVMDPRTYPLTRDIYRLSEHETQNFPLALMSINITRLAIQSLREDVLNRECNKRRQVIQTLNEFYAACFLRMYTIWKHEHKTIAHSAFVLKEVQTLAKKSPKIILTNLEQHLMDRQKNAVTNDTGYGEEPVRFQAVCDLGENDD